MLTNEFKMVENLDGLKYTIIEKEMSHQTYILLVSWLTIYNETTDKRFHASN